MHNNQSPAGHSHKIYFELQVKLMSPVKDQNAMAKHKLDAYHDGFSKFWKLSPKSTTVWLSGPSIHLMHWNPIY